MSDFGSQKTLGRACTDAERAQNKASADRIRETERMLESLRKIPEERVVWKRIAQLVDSGTFLPLNSLYNPENNPEGTVGVVTGLAKVEGKCVCVIASDPDIKSGAWLPGHPKKILRIQRLAELMRTPIVWLLECSGLDLGQQDRVYTGHESGGRIFFNNARLAARGIPIVAGIFGTNVAGGGYHAISATKRFAHKDANMAVGGTAILSGMKFTTGGFSDGKKDIDALLMELERIKKIPPPGRATIHTKTGFFDGVYDTEQEVIDAMRAYVATLNVGDFFDAQGEVSPPAYSDEDLCYLIPDNQRMTYNIEDVIGRLVDESMASEYLPDFGPEIYCGAASIDGCPVGIITNKQSVLPRGYPEYADYPGAGGKLYRQGLIKMCKFISECSKKQTPIVWFQDTSGIDVGDQAEMAGLLGLGQALVSCVENAKVPMATVILRKGHAASHYVMCGPMASSNALTLGTAVTEIMVMHKETAAMAKYGRALERTSEKERPAVIKKMNELVEKYRETSSSHYSAKQGVIDEAVRFMEIRRYLSWFVNAAYAHMPEDVQEFWTLSRIVEEGYHASKPK